MHLLTHRLLLLRTLQRAHFPIQNLVQPLCLLPTHLQITHQSYQLLSAERIVVCAYLQLLHFTQLLQLLPHLPQLLLLLLVQILTVRDRALSQRLI